MQLAEEKRSRNTKINPYMNEKLQYIEIAVNILKMNKTFWKFS